MTPRPRTVRPWHRVIAWALVVYGVITLGYGLVRVVAHPDVEVAFLAVLFAIMGLLAIAGGVVWLRGLRRAR